MVAVFLAGGFEEIEAVSVIDILRRADIDVKTVGVGEKIVVGTHNIPITCDILDSELDFSNIEMIVLPGGMPGTTNLEKSPIVQKAIDYCKDNDKFITAICAAPSVLGHKGVLKGKKAICYPGFEDDLEGALIDSASVSRDGKIITAKGPGVAIDFALMLISALTSEQTAKMVRSSLQCTD